VVPRRPDLNDYALVRILRRHGFACGQKVAVTLAGPWLVAESTEGDS
jgi:hypothetical protein